MQRADALEELKAEIESITDFNVSAFTRRINIAFGPPGDMLRLHLKSYVDLKATPLDELEARYAASAAQESRWLMDVKANKANLEQTLADAKMDKLRKEGAHADCYGNPSAVGLDGGSIEDLEARYSKNLETSAADVAHRTERVAKLEKMASDPKKAYDGAVEAAKARVVDAISKLREAKIVAA